MSNAGTFKNIIGYLGEFHQDLGQFIRIVEAQMLEREYVPLPSAGTRGCWVLSNSINKPSGWLLPYVSRFYLPTGVTRACCSAFYLVLLESESAFDFPVVLCGRVFHPEFTESEVYNKAWKSSRLKKLAYQKSTWRIPGQERGWSIAEPPPGNQAIDQVKGYILNLFEMNSRQRVMENVILPLTKGQCELDLDRALTVTRYGFHGVDKREPGEGV